MLSGVLAGQWAEVKQLMRQSRRRRQLADYKGSVLGEERRRGRLVATIVDQVAEERSEVSQSHRAPYEVQEKLSGTSSPDKAKRVCSGRKREGGVL